MTEDDNGRVRASDEGALMNLEVEQFFMKLLVFTERMDKRRKELEKNGTS